MSIRNKKEDVLFMSTGMFEHLTDAESYVFSHVAFFACQTDSVYKGLFRQTTRAICNKVGYSPNTVRGAIESLIAKNFLKVVELEEKPTLKYTYIESVAHRLAIGDEPFANQFAAAMSQMLKETKQKSNSPREIRDMTFFKVHVGKLKRNNDEVFHNSEKNKSKHLHKTLIMHGYLYNQTSWNNKRGRSNLSRGVAYLSATMQWSQNTVRRIINTLKDLGAISYQYATKTITFTLVSLIQSVSKSKINLRTSLIKTPDVETHQTTSKHNTYQAVNIEEQSPEEAAAYLEAFRKRTL